MNGKKKETRRRVVDSAARLFREGGMAKVGIDDVMAAAELTHGGFYSHFSGKDALVADALTAAFEQACRNLFGFNGGGREWLEHATQRYLCRAHLEEPGSGCAVPTLGADTSRAKPRVRRSFSKGIGRVLDEMTLRMPAPGGLKRRRAIATLSSWAGAMLIARAVDDRKLADEILDAVHKDVLSAGERR